MCDQIKLVIADIDGTLVDDRRKLSKRTREVLLCLKDRGYQVGIASGRGIEELLTLKDVWGLKEPFDIIIGMNGAQLFDQIHHRRYDFYMLQPAWIKEILDLLRPFHLNPYMIKGKTLVCLREDEEIKKSSKRNRTSIHVVKEESEFYAQPCPKIMFKIGEDQIDEVMDYANRHKKSPYSVFKTQPIMLEFTDKRTNKIHALSVFSQENGLPLTAIMAFGDMTNDNEMLRQVGYGVAMANAARDTRSSARYLTRHDNNHDGLARFILEEFQPSLLGNTNGV